MRIHIKLQWLLAEWQPTESWVFKYLSLSELMKSVQRAYTELSIGMLKIRQVHTIDIVSTN
jgi:hypothetical protein